MKLDDVIAAISTPHGEGAIGIVRACGDEVFSVAARLIPGQKAERKAWPARTAFNRRLVDPRTGEILDDALVLAFHLHHSPVGLDLVEFHCHGNPIILSRVLDALIAAGARPAEPGEFSYRAFMTGRIDLAQAEGLCDLIRARTVAAQRIAARLQAGGLSEEVNAIRGLLEPLLDHLEASIDFSDEVDEVSSEDLHAKVLEAQKRVDALMATAHVGRTYRDGVHLAIVGRPNVGKSSLLNALIGRDRAIVTNVPGTTRDTIEEEANILGIPVVAIDTAGLRHTRDTIELLGMRRTEEALAHADLALLVADASEGWQPDDDEVADRLGSGKRLVVLNKIDLIDEPALQHVVGEVQQRAGDDVAVVPVSALTRSRIGDLERAIVRAVMGAETVDMEGPIVSNARHFHALASCAGALTRMLHGIRDGLPPDVLSAELYLALKALALITGESADMDLVERIFSTFCIGK